MFRKSLSTKLHLQTLTVFAIQYRVAARSKRKSRQWHLIYQLPFYDQFKVQL